MPKRPGERQQRLEFSLASLSKALVQILPLSVHSLSVIVLFLEIALIFSNDKAQYCLASWRVDHLMYVRKFLVTPTEVNGSSGCIENIGSKDKSFN